MITYERSIKSLVQEKAALHDREVIYSVKYCLLFLSEAAFLLSLNALLIKTLAGIYLSESEIWWNKWVFNFRYM